MTAEGIRKKLVSYIQVADEKKVKALYALLEEDIEQVGRIDNEQYNKELAEAEAEFSTGDYISNAALKMQVKNY